MPPDFPSIEAIEAKLSLSIDWHGARVQFLARFLIALITVKSVCLTQIASVFPTEAAVESAYKRCQRFLRRFDLDYASLARLMVAWIAPEGAWVLSLDRTEWKLGKVPLNVLKLGLVYRGVAFPLFWMVLGKAGTSNAPERIALLERFVAVFGAGRIAFVCADREFACRKLLVWLLSQGIGFRLRIKGDVHVTNARGVPVPVARLFQNCPQGQERRLGQRMCLGQQVYVSGTRHGSDYVIVISEVEAPLSDYVLRWPIETLFGCLKSRGFDLEATHVCDPERLSKLLGLLALAFCWAMASGMWLQEKRPEKIKKHGRPARSLFRRGLDWLRGQLCPLAGRRTDVEFCRAVQLLSCT